MRNDESFKKKIEKAAERMTHKIAKDIENTDRKRKIDTRVGVTHGDADTSVERMSDTGAQGSQEELEREVKKRVRFSEGEEPGPRQVDSEIADSAEAQDGSAHGAVVLGHKRKRDLEDEGGKGMDIDAIGKVSSPSGVAHGDAVGGSSV